MNSIHCCLASIVLQKKGLHWIFYIFVHRWQQWKSFISLWLYGNSRPCPQELSREVAFCLQQDRMWNLQVPVQYQSSSQVCVAVVPKPSRIELSSGALRRCVVSSDPNTPMPSIHISVRNGICYVRKAWTVGSNGTCHALLLPIRHIFAVGCHYCKVSHPIPYSMTVIPNISFAKSTL